MTPSHGFRGKRHASAHQDPPVRVSSDPANLGVRIPRTIRPVGFFRTGAGIFRTQPGDGLGRTAIRIASVFDGCLQRGYDTLSNGDNS
jgi:hypothetical protein